MTAIAPYVGITVGSVAGTVGAALVLAAWQGEAPKRSGLGMGIGLVALGAVLMAVSNRSLR